MLDDLIPLAQVPRAISHLTGEASPSYRAIYNRTLDGGLPAQRIGGRWHIRAADLPAVVGIMRHLDQRQIRRSRDTAHAEAMQPTA